MPVLVLMRHGQSQWNLENRFTGFTDVELTKQGRNEAQEAGLRLKAEGLIFDVCYTSTLKRACETAQIALQAMGQTPDMIRADDLRERDYGGLTGLNKDETVAKYGADQVRIWRRSYDIPPPEGDVYKGESLQDVVEKRVGPYFKAHIVPDLRAGKTVLVAAHGNTVRGILVALGLRNRESIVATEIPTGQPLRIDLSDDLAPLSENFLI